MDKEIILTQEEVKLIYVACENYAKKLEETIKIIPNEEEDIQNIISKKSNKYYRLARKIVQCMED